MLVVLLNLMEPLMLVVMVWYFWPALKWYYQDLRRTFSPVQKPGVKK